MQPDGARELERRGGSIALIHDEIYREQCFVERVDFARLYANTFVEQAVKVHAWIASCADVFAQRVALHVFQTNALAEHAAWYAGRVAGVRGTLRESGLRFVDPEGAFYALVRLRHGAGSLEAALRLVEEYDIIAIPGIAFGESCEGWLRLSWVAPPEQFREGLRRIALSLERGAASALSGE